MISFSPTNDDDRYSHIAFHPSCERENSLEMTRFSEQESITNNSTVLILIVQLIYFLIFSYPNHQQFDLIGTAMVECLKPPATKQNVVRSFPFFKSHLSFYSFRSIDMNKSYFILFNCKINN
jgi:hypothetical protein